jgi:hypothetical protein
MRSMICSEVERVQDRLVEGGETKSSLGPKLRLESWYREMCERAQDKELHWRFAIDFCLDFFYTKSLWSFDMEKYFAPLSLSLSPGRPRVPTVQESRTWGRDGFE